MAKALPSLRNDIEVMPSPAPDQPGSLIRDPLQYSSSLLIIPPVLVPALAFLDGEKTDLDLQAFLTRRLGQLVPSDIVNDLVKTLDDHGFLQTERFETMREARRQELLQCPERKPAHAGTAYPAEREHLHEQLAGYMEPMKGQSDPPPSIGVAAPHVSLTGGWKSYSSAYARLSPELADKVFVILGTSHYGQPQKFGLTRKPFVTPLGTLDVATALVDRLAERAGDSVLMEDYCHFVEHSIEFQCLFLQHAVSPRCRILPILCGPFLRSLLEGKPPEADEGVARFFDALHELAGREGSRLFWILGIDLTHTGKRYGDPFAAHAEQDSMAADLWRQDSRRLARVCAGDRDGFLDLVVTGGDKLRWCGYSPLYTFLKSVPAARGHILNYEQWNIDKDSVVSFAALEFFREL